MPSPLRQAEERSNNQSAAWPINPASSRNPKPPPVRRWRIHAVTDRSQLAVDTGSSRIELAILMEGILPLLMRLYICFGDKDKRSASSVGVKAARRRSMLVARSIGLCCSNAFIWVVAAPVPATSHSPYSLQPELTHPRNHVRLGYGFVLLVLDSSRCP